MKSYYKGPLSDHFDGVRFFNPWNRHHPSFWAFLRWRFSANPKPWPKSVASLTDIPPRKVQGSSLRISFVGHSTVLIQTQNLNILTDPIWSKRASPLRWLGAKRVTAPGILFEKLPKIDLVLISHNHYDHLDLPTLKKLWDRDMPRMIAPLGNDVLIQAKHPEITVETLDWNESLHLDKIAVHLEPAQHWSARNLRDRDRALWGAFVIDTPGGKIYFAGDSGYGKGEHFRKTRKKFGSFRFAMLPIGAFEPKWFMHYAHMNPEEAVLARHDLGEPNTMALHFGSFHLSDEGYDQPVLDLAKANEKHGGKNEGFRALSVGEVWEFPSS